MAHPTIVQLQKWSRPGHAPIPPELVGQGPGIYWAWATAALAALVNGTEIPDPKDYKEHPSKANRG